MAYKTIRNQALRGATKLITGVEQDGTKWFTPDGYFATKFDIFSDYKVKKEQIIPEQNPKMEFILDNLPSEYIKASNRGLEDGTEFVRIQGGQYWSLINPLYLQLLQKIYPESELQIAKDERGLSPIKLVNNNELVALIMPVKR